MVSGEAVIVMRRHAFARAVEQGLTRCGVQQGDRVLIACSGGADSVALLLATAALATLDKWALDVHVAHVNHHLRDEAEADAAFAESTAREFDAAFHRADIDPKPARGNLEAAARAMRYDALASIARRIDADHVATAHHADDQLETLVMRMIRGAGLRGMRGIHPVRSVAGVRIIRPMLATTHENAAGFLRDVGHGWREDSTNADTSRTRARLRATVLPVLRSINPRAAENAARTADRLRTPPR